MGLFHCPMGSIYRDDDPCIDCGLCQAKTKQELVAASKKIRDHLHAHAQKSSTVSKIAVCGKGGAGKTTVVTLLANVMAEQGYKVLLIDTDDSNHGLPRMLGLEKEPTALLTLLSRFSDDKTSSHAKWLLKDKIAITDIPEKYIATKGNLKFMMSGKITDPFEGCACLMAGVARDLLSKLVLEPSEKVIVDTEAGVESFGRGVERSVDTVLTVVEPSFESLSLSEKISYMAEGIGVNTVKALLNRVPSEKIEKKMIERLSKANIESIGSIYFDLKVNEDAFEGNALGESAAKDDARKIVQSLTGLF